uniref:Putative secreted protein n=1 Tax=Ixodes ricinus TaxID=34613 RepID=A0A6B0TQR9_IXORI
MTRMLMKIRGILMTVLTEWIRLMICDLAPGSNPCDTCSRPQFIFSRNLFSWSTAIAFTHRSAASNRL